LSQQHQEEPQQQQPQRRLLLRENSIRKQAAVFNPQRHPSSSRQPIEPASKNGTAERLAEEADNKTPIGKPKKDCYGRTTWF